VIKEFVSRYEANKEQLRATFEAEHPKSYFNIVEAVIRMLSTGEVGAPDHERVHEIDDGDYQGTLLYVIGGAGYQPSSYWYVKVDYGSCSGCDTLESIKSDGNWGDKPNKQQVADYMTLALHIVQGLKELE
jgi:hypothetical protein